MRVVADEMGAGDRVIPGLKCRGVELVICIGRVVVVVVVVVQLDAPMGGDLHGFSILQHTHTGGERKQIDKLVRYHHFFL